MYACNVKGGRTAGAQLLDSTLLARFSSVRRDVDLVAVYMMMVLMLSCIMFSFPTMLGTECCCSTAMCTRAIATLATTDTALF
jgi:cytochrome b subunit of formate dehydrogenase